MHNLFLFNILKIDVISIQDTSKSDLDVHVHIFSKIMQPPRNIPHFIFCVFLIQIMPFRMSNKTKHEKCVKCKNYFEKVCFYHKKRTKYFKFDHHILKKKDIGCHSLIKGLLWRA